MRTSIGVQAYVYVCICIRAALQLSPARPCRYASLAGMQPANASAARVSDILVHLYRFLVVLSLLVPQPLHLPLRWLKWYLWLCHWRFMPRRTHCTRVSVCCQLSVLRCPQYKLPHCADTQDSECAGLHGRWFDFMSRPIEAQLQRRPELN